MCDSVLVDMWRSRSAQTTVTPPDQMHVYRVTLDAETYPSLATTNHDTSPDQETTPIAAASSLCSSLNMAIQAKGDALQSLIPSTEHSTATTPCDDTCARKRKRGDSTDTEAKWEHFQKMLREEDRSERRPSDIITTPLDSESTDSKYCRKCHIVVETAHQREGTLIRAMHAAQEREAEMTRELRRAREIQNALLDVINGLKVKEREARREQYMAQVNKDAMRKRFEQCMDTYSRREAAIREKVQGWMEDQSQTRNKLKWQAERLEKYETTLGMVFETVPELRAWIEMQMAQDDT